jgi:hypothetical protein
MGDIGINKVSSSKNKQTISVEERIDVGLPRIYSKGNFIINKSESHEVYIDPQMNERSD